MKNHTNSNSLFKHIPTRKFQCQLLTCGLGILTALGTGASSAKASFATPGQGLNNVLAGSVANGALFLNTVPLWNNAQPTLPYTNEVAFTLPACSHIVVSRLIMTVWGGTANYVSELTVFINGVNLPAGAPLVFGTTNDANAVFNANLPCAYGAGSGLWLVTLPVPGSLLYTNGTSNFVRIVETSTNGFDGRLHYATLMAVYQSANLTNVFNYALAEGSGDIYGTPTAVQTDQRTVAFGPATPTNVTAAKLHALYTYGDTGQNDRLYFNGTALGGNDIAQWDKSLTNYGPSVVSFEVSPNLLTTNAVRFSVAAGEVTGTRETSLRPQLAVLEITRLPAPPQLAIDLNVVLQWPASADNYQLEYRSNLSTGVWTTITNTPMNINGQNMLLLPQGSPQEFYQLRKTN
jgi:hypothetical protein